jgi:hypothetical protein
VVRAVWRSGSEEEEDGSIICFLLFISTKMSTPDKEGASLPGCQIHTLPGHLDAFRILNQEYLQ